MLRAKYRTPWWVQCNTSHGKKILGETMLTPMPLMCTSFEPGHLEEALATITDPDAHAIAIAESHLYCAREAQAVEAARPYLNHPDPALRYSACLISGYANLSLHNIAEAHACLSSLLAPVDPAEDDVTKAAHILMGAAASVLLHLPSPFTLEEFYPLVGSLPEGLRLFSSYVMAHAFYLHGEYGRCVGAALNSLVMKQGSYPVSELFLHLVASMGYMSLKEVDRARWHFQTAWSIARPDDMIEPVGMHHGLLQGLVEVCLKGLEPKEFSRVIEITYRFSYGWRRIHNPESGENVADDLTSTEFTVSMLACRGWTNAEIAKHLGVSPGTVKNRLSTTYAKLGISSRAELAARMLK